MWCQICGQDVPGIPSLEEGKYSCARCGERLVSISHEPAGSASTCESETKDDTAQPATASTAAQRPPIYDGWEIDEQLRHFRRVLGQTPASREKFNEPAAQPRFRVDASHGVAAPHRKRARRLSRKTRQAASAAKQHVPGDRVLAMLAWTTMSLGTMGFVCGLALMSWSANMGRQDLWSIGSPVLLAGQIALVLGLILQIDRVWRNSRRAAARMETVDEQIHDLKTASSLRDTHGPSSAFYAHWASGAGAEILLGDLKSQLDLLAVKLSKP